VATTEELILKILANTKDIKTKLSNTTKDIDKVGKSTKQASDTSKGTLASMKVAWIAVGAAVFKAVNYIKDFMNAAVEQRRVEAQLNAVLESTGHSAGLAASELKQMAKDLQGMTNFGDEAVIGAENLLLTFTNIGKDVFPEALETVLDMSTALGQDLKSSSIQLGKALNDPILGMTALRRVGVNFNKEQAEMVKGMVEAGQTFEAQKFILNELKTEFGGSAKAMVAVDGGATQLKNAFGDLKEVIGTELIKASTDGNKALTKFLQSKTTIDALRRSVRALIDILWILKEVVAAAFDSWEIAIRSVLDPWAILISSIVKAVKGDFREALTTAKDGFKNLGSGIKEEALSIANRMVNIKNLLKNIIDPKDTAEVIAGLKGINKELENLDDVQVGVGLSEQAKTFGKGIAQGFTNALKAESGRQGAESITSALRNMLSQAGWWGSIIAAFLEMFERKTPGQISKFIQELGTATGDIIEKVFSGLISYLANPANIAQLIGALFSGIANAISQIFTKEFWVEAFSDVDDALDTITGQNQAIQDLSDKLDKNNASLKDQIKQWETLLKEVAQAGTTQDVIDEIVEKIDNLKNLLREETLAQQQAEIDSIYEKLKLFNQQVQLGNNSLEDQIEYYKQIIKELEAAGESEYNINNLQIELNGLIDTYNTQLEESNQLLEDQRITWNRINSILNSMKIDELIGLFEQLGIMPEDIGLAAEETANLQSIVRLLNQQSIEGLEFRLRVLNAILDRMEKSNDTLADRINIENEILNVQEQLNDLRESETDILSDQEDITDQIRRNQLDALNALRGFISEYLGLKDVPQFLIDPILDQLDLAGIGLKVNDLSNKILESGLDISNLIPPQLEDISATVGNIDSLNRLVELLPSLMPAGANTSISFGDINAITNEVSEGSSFESDLMLTLRKWGFPV